MCFLHKYFPCLTGIIANNAVKNLHTISDTGLKVTDLDMPKVSFDLNRNAWYDRNKKRLTCLQRGGETDAFEKHSACRQHAAGARTGN